MAEQFCGRYTVLDPPLNVGGTAYGAAVAFGTNPGKPASAHIVVSGVFAANPSGSTSKTVACRRDFQSDSYFVPRDQGGPYEQIFPVLMGGNVCQTHEAQRLYSWANGRAIRGGDALDRAQPGDVLWWQGRGFLITGCEAFAQAPDEVSWQGDESLPVVVWIDVDFQDLRLAMPDRSGVNTDAVLHVPDGDTGFFADSGFYVASTKLARKVFDNPSTSEPDEAYYPPAAGFASGEHYWLDLIGGAIRLASAVESIGDELTAVYWHRNLIETAEASPAILVVEGTGAGYGTNGGVEDLVTAVGVRTQGDIFKGPFIYSKPDGHYGAGSVEWRAAASAGAIVVAVTWDEDGVVTGILARYEQDGEIEPVSFTPNASLVGDQFFNLIMLRDGEDFTILILPEGGSAIGVATVVVPGLGEERAGIFSVCAWGSAAVRFASMGVAGETIRLVPFSTGVLSRLVVSTFSGIEYSKGYGVPTATALGSVENMSAHGAPVAMGESATARRDRYTLGTGTIILTSETAGDRIRLTFEAPEGEPEKPGRAPRLGGTVNGAVQDSENVNENRANWLDTITVHDPHGELLATAGEAFEIRRDPVFDSRNPPSLSWAIHGDPGQDWQAMDSGDFLARWTEGLVLIKKAFLDALPPGALPCLRAAGHRFSQAGNMPARAFNDVAKAVAALDELWVSVGIAGGGGLTEASGLVGYPEFGPTATVCLDCFTTRGVGFAWGTRKELLAATAALDYPGWLTADIYEDPVGNIKPFTAELNGIWTECCPGGAGYNHNTEIAAGCYLCEVNPNGNVGFIGGYYGEDLWGCIWPGWGSGHPELSQAVFKFRSVPVAAWDVLSRIPDGAEILEAFAPVTVHELRHHEWSFEFEHHPGTSTRGLMVINGIAAVDFEKDGSGAVIRDDGVGYDLETQYVSEGAMSYQLVGRERDSKIAHSLADGRELTVAVHRYSFLGGGLSIGGDIADEKTKLVDVTNLVRALVLHRDSKYADFFLWPSRAGVDPGESPGSLAGYAESLLPSLNGSQFYDEDGNSHIDISGSGSLTGCNGIAIGQAMVRFRMPSGILGTVKTPPIIRPAMMPIE